MADANTAAWIEAGFSGDRAVESRARIKVGDSVQVRDFRRLPMAGHFGSVNAIDPEDAFGDYLVHFGSGLQFRYREAELIDLTNTGRPQR